MIGGSQLKYQKSYFDISFSHLESFSHYLDASSDLLTVGEGSVVGLCVLWGGLLWPLSLLLGIHPIQKDTLSPKHCSHHGQRPSPTPHLHTVFQSAPESLQKRPDSSAEGQPCDLKLRMPTRLTNTKSQRGEGDQRNAASGTPCPRDCQTDCCRRCSPLDELSACATLQGHC